MLKVNNLEVMYDKVILVLKGMSMEVPKGKIVALLGSNGAGKTTTLKAISGLLKSENGQVTDGYVEFDGERISTLDAEQVVKKGVFQCMEGRRVFEHLSVEDNLYAGAHTRKDRSQLKHDLEKVYHYFPKLEMLKNRQAGYLSGGEQQMLAIGRGMMARPKVLLLDEPSLGIAPLLVKEIFSIIKRINEEEGTTILVVEQNANVALSIAHYGYIMENGRIVMDGPVEQLLANQDVKEFYLGTSQGGRKNYREVKSYKRRKRWL
ncbi:ABC transporter ATP-binding protein [Ectobacillus antri]|jgi:branched-chain amino acid transport system ATP-binding protein|uniref:ABC transporter ATP-binding protein n=1 Tax=Ectobacillus antri TaxID=2486280 RepID=A0ABT6H326_9BACI|nr:ABC transporter ATP-binding protein [Ectobacillus antri]MDG4657482.1 ABC transporter ATP-binding protein [Ectobacillus antri]MDG5753795.1 ABC transporter ATP-binding protein [Ectobacillus antri]